MHPLVSAYIDSNKTVFGSWPFIVKDQYRIDAAASKVHKLGISYALYTSTVCRLYEKMAKDRGWKFIYWNVKFADSTVVRIEQLVKNGIISDDEEDDNLTDYEYELAYALDIIAFVKGELDEEPVRSKKISTDIKMKVSAYICDLASVEFMSSDYKFIARQIIACQNI